MCYKRHNSWMKNYSEVLKWFGEEYAVPGLIQYLLVIGYSPTGWPDIPSESARSVIAQYGLLHQKIGEVIKGKIDNSDDKHEEDYDY